MAQSLDASVSSLMSCWLVAKSFAVAEYIFVSFCMTWLNFFGWNSFLTSCPLLLLWRITSVWTVHLFYWYCVCWTARSDGDCQLIPPVHKVSFLSILLVFGLVLLCLYVVWDLSWTVSSRETGNVFQSLKFNQTVSHICGNFSKMIVAELAVFS